jgi:hypothetical protein
MKYITLIIFILITSPALAKEDRSWHLLTQTYGGNISLLHKLTKNECEFSRARAKGLPATEEEKLNAFIQELNNQIEREKYKIEHPNCYNNESNPDYSTTAIKEGCLFTGSGIATFYSEGDIKSAECFQ